MEIFKEIWMDESCRPGKRFACELKVESFDLYIQLLLALYKRGQGSTGNDKQKEENKFNAIEVLNLLSFLWGV